MENDVKIFEVKQNINSFNANEICKASPVTLVNFFNDAAWKHANILNIGSNKLLTENKTWVLSSLQFQFLDFPKWGEEILIRTWASGKYRIFATREVEIYSSSKKLLANGTSYWFIIDLKTRRPMRPEIYNAMNDKIFPKRIELSFNENITFPADEDMQLLDKFTAQYSDLDWNGHINNSTYIKWLYDALGRDYHRKYKVDALHIRFLSEVLYLQNVQIFANSKENPSKFRYINFSTNKIAAEAEIIFSYNS